MFLRSLSLRGFKSFADKTTISVEPGITVIVGPNGSGKSNVVDSLAWVLGTHSAKKVRGGSMSDVIFAGSPTRSRANQARVEIVIDNSDGQLAGGVGAAASAAEFAEVRIARVIHHDGDTGYEINGEDVRALDVQELLSDTGLGRELHTIVGQGQLDEILNARPEERRRYIEEAAGILKHRRRRERAVRKLEQVDGHIEKLRTVLRELRRQLRPLERQAEAADRFAALQTELRDVQSSIAAHEVVHLRQRLADEGSDSAATERELEQIQRRLEETRRNIAEREQREGHDASRLEGVSATLNGLTSLGERIRGTADLTDAKRRHLIEYVEEPLAGRPPDELRAHADQLDQQRSERDEQRQADRQRLDAAIEARREAEAARREHEQQLQAERRRRAEQRERVLRWEGEISALRGAIANSEAEYGRVSSSIVSLETSIEQAQAAMEIVQNEIQELDRREMELTSNLEAAEREVQHREDVLERLRNEVREIESERAAQLARAEALRAALAEADAGTTALLSGSFAGVMGRVAEHVKVEAAVAPAVAAVLGPLGDAVVTATADDARDAVRRLRNEQTGGAVVVAADAFGRGAGERGATLVQDARATPLEQFVAAAQESATAQSVAEILRSWVAGSYLADSWDAAVDLHRTHPELTFVTAEGDVASSHGYRASGSSDASAVATAAAADAAQQRADALAVVGSERSIERDAADKDAAKARGQLAEATERINESDARITGAAERLARLNKELHALVTQRDIVQGQSDELAQVLDRDRAALSELHGRGPETDVQLGSGDPEDDSRAHELDAVVETAREAELDARVHLERTTEQVRNVQVQADALRQEAAEVEIALADAARRREQRRRGIERCGELTIVVRALLAAVEQSVAAAQTERSVCQQAVQEHRAALAQLRETEQRIAAERDRIRDSHHAADLRRTELTGRLDSLVNRVRNELAIDADVLLDQHPDASGYDAEQLREREEVLVRKIGLLGRVNPLALEEFTALQERHAFLSEQLDDLRKSRRDLESVIEAVDDRIRRVFKEAFDDVAREFELTFSTVFPGGHGRLVMTEADDLLRAGIEVEARPPGKRVTRLSLLSGGERSLTVLAFVFAIFRARPSPFYVLDEVDAALDDVNLQRLLRVVRSFRGHAQIIMVTHQKRTMEIADLLYGVTMGPGGVTKVVAERLEDLPADLVGAVATGGSA